MNNDNITLKDIYDNIDSIDDNICKRLSKVEKLTVNLLNETRKTNILLKKNTKEKMTIDIEKFDSIKHSNRSLVIINDSFLTVKGYAQTLADNSDKALHIVDLFDGDFDPASMLKFKLNDYVLINYNSLSYEEIKFIKNALLENCIIAGEVRLQLEPANYIIYSDMLELLDEELIKELQVVC